MTLIQLILIFGLLASLGVYLRFFRSELVDRLIAILLFMLAAIGIFSPDSTTVLANVLGVGRGADLLFYLFAVITAFLLILIYSKVARLSNSQTELARHIALMSAKAPEDRSSSS